VLEPPEDQNAVRQLLLGGKPSKGAGKANEEAKASLGVGRTVEEDRIRAAAARAKKERDGG
jgi:hypothetical protein